MAINLHQAPKTETQLDPENCSIEVKQRLCKGLRRFLPHKCLSPDNRIFALSHPNHTLTVLNRDRALISFRRGFESLAAFSPLDAVALAIAAIARQRENLMKSATTHVLWRQKALTQINLYLPQVISDLTGVTGLAMIRANCFFREK